jgi:hypothetical protein
VVHLKRQPAAKVRDFLNRYQDRVLYATDMGIVPGQDAASGMQAWIKQIEADWAYFSKPDGLGLAEPVLRKIFHENAVKWVPGAF